MDLIDQLHQNDIGVILDWVSSHFPNDEHGLVYFDGTYLYEHADPKKGFHPEWKSYILPLSHDEVIYGKGALEGSRLRPFPPTEGITPFPLSCRPSGCYFLKVKGAKEARSDLWNFSPRLRSRF